MTKAKWKKGLYIALAIAVVILIVWGIVVMTQRPSTGTQQVMASSSSLENVIRSSSAESLSDEQFIYGVDNIIPQCTATEQEQLEWTLDLQHNLQEIAGDDIECKFLNWFGEAAAVVELDELSDPTLLLETLSLTPQFSRIIINMKSKDTGLVTREAIYENGIITEHFVNLEALQPQDKAPIKGLQEQLLDEFGISEEAISYSGDCLVLTLNTSAPACLDIFDYTFRWLKQNNLNPDIIITSNGVLWAAADLKSTEALYTRYDTKSELAPLFHMTFYYTCNFFKNDLQEQCQIYL